MSDQPIEAKKATIPDLVAAGEVGQFQAMVREEFGFEPSEAYAAAMIAFVDGCLAEVAELRRQVASLSQKPEIEIARAGWVRVLDPDNGRFLFEYNPDSHSVLWRNRKQIKLIDLRAYKQEGEKP